MLTSSPDEQRAAHRYGLIWAQMAVGASLIGVWAIVSATGMLSGAVLPDPSRFADRLVSLAALGATWHAISQTMEAWIIGLALAFVIGTILGVLIGISPFAYQSSRLLVDFLRSVPAVALIPVALLLFGTRLQMQLVIIVFAAVWIVLVQVMSGVLDVDPVATDVARSCRLSKMQRICLIIVPSVAPYVGTGLRLGASVALFMALGAELLGGAPGLGASILAVQTTGGYLGDAYVYGFLAAVLAVMVNVVFLGVERWVLKWHPRYR